MIDWPKLSEDVRVQRARKRVSVRDAAREIGVSPATLSRFENGKELTSDNFMAVCKWLGVAAEETLI